jgi:hypothetical protein
VAVYVYAYGGGGPFMAMRFENWNDYIEHCKKVGTLSEGGANYGYYD